MSTATVNGITVEYDDRGSGADVLVLVHGHPFDRSMWRPQVERFSRSGWRVVAADLRGYGRHGGAHGGTITLLGDFARDVTGLADRLGIDRFVLGGLSMGGQIVLETYRLFPDRIRGLLLADTSARAETPEGRQQRNETADRLLREGMAGYADEVLPKMLAPRNILARPDVARHVLAMMRAAPAAGAAAALRGRAERPDYVDMLPSISVPTAVVVGSDDEYTPVGEARLMAERIPGAILAVIDGAGHLPNLEREDGFDDALAGLLESVDRTATTER